MSIIFEDKDFELALRKKFRITEKKITSKSLSAVKGIIVSNVTINGFNVPWSADGSGFSMINPNFEFLVQNSKNGKWVNDLKHFKHTEALYIYVPTDSLPGIKGMENLKQLYITNSKNEDWSFLEKLLFLDYLYVADSNFSDLTSLGNLGIYQEENGLIHPVFKTKFGLSHLCLLKCGITDISPLSKCSYLSELNLSHNKIEDVYPLCNLQNLYYLTMRWTKVTDIRYLKRLKSLYSLNLRHNKITDLSPVLSLNISRLYMSDNPIKDYSILKGFYFVQSDISYKGERKLEEFY